VHCERAVARRLMEMGLLPGTRVSVTRIGPFGDPIELRVRGYALSIRRHEAAAIEVTGVRRPAPAALPVRRYEAG
jgi:ferrous iron transport protein A